MSTPLTPANALKLSAWLALHEPGFFSLVLAKAANRSPHVPFGFLGDDSPVTTDSGVIDVGLVPDASVTVTASPDTGSGIDLSSFTPQLQDIGTVIDSSTPGIADSVTASITDAIASPPPPDPSTANADSSFWSSVSSGLGSAAAAVGKAAQALISPQVVSSLASAAGAYFTAQARSNVAQATLQAQQAAVQGQQLALQTQLARAQAGLAPAPITYVRSATGQVTPVYASSSGAQPLTGTLANLLTPSTVGGTPTIVWIGAGLLVLWILTSSRSSS